MAPAVARRDAAGPEQGDQDRAEDRRRAGLADDRRVDEVTGRDPARDQEHREPFGADAAGAGPGADRIR